MVGQVLAAESSNLQIEFNNKGTIKTLPEQASNHCSRKSSEITNRTHPKDSQNHEKDDLKEMPISIICDLEKDELASTERVHCLFGRTCDLALSWRDGRVNTDG
jgi:hypothetical protein